MLLTLRIGSNISSSASEIRADDLRMALDLQRRTSCKRSAKVECENAVRHSGDELHVVLDHQHRDAEQILDVLDPEGHFVSLFDIEPGRRLVEQQQLWIGAKGARQLGDLPRAIRQVDDERVTIRLQIEKIDHLFDGLTVLNLHAPHGWQKQKLAEEARSAVHMARQ